MTSAMTLLDRGPEEAERLDVGRPRRSSWRVRLARWVMALLVALLAVAAALALLARRERAQAEANLALARLAVDDSLTAADRDPLLAGADVPQFQAFRRDTLAAAERFYTALLAQPETGESSRRNHALAQARLGQINRMRERPGEAIRAYQEAITGLRDLAERFPEKQEYPAALADAFTALADLFRLQTNRAMDAEHAYGNAFELRQRLARDSPGNAQHLEQFANIYYHRGLLRAQKPGGSPEANADFLESIRLLEPLAAASDRSAQDLAHVYGSLGRLLAQDPEGSSEARVFWEKAIGIDERLVIKDPANREARLELARLCNNLASLLAEKGDVDEADRRSRMALGLIDSLIRATPSLEVERADAHRLRALILQGDDPQEALVEYEEALDLFEPLLSDHDLQRLPAFHQRYGDLLLSLAAFPAGKRDTDRAQRLLSRGVGLYTKMAGAIVASGTRAAVLNAAESVGRLLPSMPDSDQAVLGERLQQLQRRAAADGAR